MDKLSFNSSPLSVMHIDLNSCFATIEQQANPFLRGRPIAVAAYDSPGGCILAPSIEAKRYGIKTGMRVKEGRKLYSKLIVRMPDPPKYRFVHKKLRKIIGRYTPDFHPKSIDEFVLHFDKITPSKVRPLTVVAQEIKSRIKKEIGEFITVSIGIAPNRFLAKTAAGLHKPDGLDEINSTNFLEVYKTLTLRDLCGINYRNEARLLSVGITSVSQMYQASLPTLNSAFKSIASYYWYMRLRGWEIDNIEFGRRSYGNSYTLPSSNGTYDELIPILYRLVEKTGARMRAYGYKTKGIAVSISFKDGGFCQHGETLSKEVFDTRDIYKESLRILKLCPLGRPVHVLAESCFNLSSETTIQTELFTDTLKKNKLTEAIDAINNRWDDTSLTFGSSLKLKNEIKDRIAFGGVREV